MGGLFSKPKTITPLAPAPAVVAAEPELFEEAGEEEKKKVRRRRGRAKTIITGELEPETTKRTLLG